MAANKHGVDLEEIVRNAYAQGVNLLEIAVFYEGLSILEKRVMMEQDLLKYDADDMVIASFANNGEALFPDKVKGVHYLGA